MKKSIGAKTLVYPTPVFLVGSYSERGKPNLMTVAWGGICCSQPPCIAISLRKATFSYENIVHHQAFTVSVPSSSQVRMADYVGMHSGRTEDKFGALGLTPVKSDLVDAPYIGECPLVLECKVIHTREIGLHTQFIGEILDVKVEEDMLNDEGHPDVQKIAPFIFAPFDRGYYRVGEFIGRAFSIGQKEEEE